MYVNMKNKDILKEVSKIVASGNGGSLRVYSDMNWQLELDISHCGNIRMWVSYEYRNGAYNSSLCTYRGNGVVAADFQMKGVVRDKAASVWRAITEVGLGTV